MKFARVLVLALTLPGLSSACRPQHLLKGNHPLQPAEIAAVLKAVRGSLAGKTLRLMRPEDSSGAAAREMVIGPNGLPHFQRARLSYDAGWVAGSIDGDPISTHYHVDALVITEFTGRKPRGCDGTQREGEWIFEYTDEGHGWTTRAKTRRDLGYPAGAFDILTGALASQLGERGFVGGRIARAFIAQWTPPPDGHAQPPLVIGDPFPNVRGNPPRRAATTQKLWIDVDSLLPLQWETPVDAFAFRYDPTIAITRPDGIVPPACVP